MLAAGTVLQGRYVVRNQIGQGGMGHVYCAEDRQLPGTLVAIKHMVVSIDDAPLRETIIQQFQREAQILRGLKHDNIPRVYGYFEENGQYYLAMDFVEGQPLSRVVDISGRGGSAGPPLADVLDWSLQVARALKYLHSRKPEPVIYKDLKPDNLMLTPEGTIMLIDFGIAKAQTPDGGDSRTLLKGACTPGYAAPEQYGSTFTATDPRTDLYALGATMYTLISGEVPLESVQRQEALYEGGDDPLQPLQSLRAAVPAELDALITHLLAVRRTDRVQTAEEAAATIERLLEMERAAPTVEDVKPLTAPVSVPPSLPHNGEATGSLRSLSLTDPAPDEGDTTLTSGSSARQRGAGTSAGTADATVEPPVDRAQTVRGAALDGGRTIMGAVAAPAAAGPATVLPTADVASARIEPPIVEPPQKAGLAGMPTVPDFPLHPRDALRESMRPAGRGPRRLAPLLVFLALLLVVGSVTVFYVLHDRGQTPVSQASTTPAPGASSAVVVAETADDVPTPTPTVYVP